MYSIFIFANDAIKHQLLGIFETLKEPCMTTMFESYAVLKAKAQQLPTPKLLILDQNMLDIPLDSVQKQLIADFSVNQIVLLHEHLNEHDTKRLLQIGILDTIHYLELDISVLRRTLRLARQQRAVQQRLAEIRHEFRTPLQAIIGLCHLSERTPTIDNSENIRSIQQSSRLMTNLLNTLCAPDGAPPYPLEEFCLSELIERIFFLLRPQAAHLELSYQLEVTHNNWRGNTTQLQQILLNLLNNAIKYTPQGTVQLRILELEKAENQSKLRFIVEDTGIGIQKQQQNRIFIPFNQLDHTKSGQGLGLSITQQLVKHLKGDLSIASIPTQGTTVTVDLSFEQTKPSSTSNTPATHHSKTFTKLRLLLVEDHDISRLVTKKIIEKQHIQVDIAKNGKEALQLLQRRQYDVVLLDIQMPIMDGYQTIQHIRQHWSTLPVVAMTGYRSLADGTHFRQVGFDGHILKPFEPETLIQTIKRYVNRLSMNVTTTTTQHQFIDLTYLNLMADGDKMMKKLMLDMLLDEVPAEISIMCDLYEQQDWDELRRVSHKMKTTLAFVGNDLLASTNRDIGRICKQRTDLHQLPELFGIIKNVYPKIISELQEELGKLNQVSC